VIKYYNIPDLLPALALFVNEIRGEKIGRPLSNRNLERRFKEFEWVGRYFVYVYSSFRCWKLTGKNPLNKQEREPDLVRVTENWWKSGKRRLDCVLVQEYSENESKGQENSAVDPNPLIISGKMVGTL
jgi:hypothetical protein